MLEQEDPFGETRMDWRFAKLTCDLARVLGFVRPDNAPLEPKDFLLSFEAKKETAPVKSEEELKQERIKFIERAIGSWCNGANAILKESQVKQRGRRT